MGQPRRQGDSAKEQRQPAPKQLPTRPVERQIRVIGPFQARRDGHLQPLPHSAERVLAAAALIGPLSRSHAGALLWPDADTTRSSANLRAALSRMATADDRFLHLSGEVLSLPDTVTLDVDDTLLWINETIYGTANSAVSTPPASIGKQLLPGWDEEWLTDVRERLQLLQTQALEVAAERLIAAGRTAEALPYALSAVQAQPWSESTNRLIIEIHARRGDPSNALRRYHRFRRALEEELGVQPGPDMLAAIRQLYPFGNIPPEPVGQPIPHSSAG